MIIGLCGKPQSGKTEVRRILNERFGFEVVNSKSVLYTMSAYVTGLKPEDFSHPDLKNNAFNGATHRQITGELGNAVERLFGDSYLIKRALEAHKVWHRADCNFVVDSLRKEQGWELRHMLTVVEVVSDRGIDTGNWFDSYNGDAIKYRLTNNGSFEELEKEIAKMMDELR